MVRKRRGPQRPGERDTTETQLEQEYYAALSQAGGTGVSTTGQLAPGEASPGTLESGGMLSASGRPEPLVANPFHSERVKTEIALRRSRPSTLDQEAERMEAGAPGLQPPTIREELREEMLEPDYQSAFQAPVRDGVGPRVARVEAPENGTGAVTAVPSSAVDEKAGSVEELSRAPMADVGQVASTVDERFEPTALVADEQDAGGDGQELHS